MKSLFVIIPFLLLGCSGQFTHGDWTGNICITPAFNDDENILIYQATQEWKEKSGDNVNLQVSILNNHDENGCDGIVFRKNLVPKHLGVTARPALDGDPVNIYLSSTLFANDTSQDNVFYAVALHEIGHYLGPNHSPYCDDIMYWRARDTVRHLSDRDVNQLWHPYPQSKYDDLDYCL